MNKMKIKTKEIAEAYQVLSNSRYTRLADADKIKLWRITRTMRPAAKQYLEDVNDAQKRFMPDEDYMTTVQNARVYEQHVQAGRPTDIMTAEEYKDFIATYKNYVKTVDEAIRDLGDKEVEITVEPFDDETFSKLMASNEWTMEQALCVGNILLQ